MPIISVPAGHVLVVTAEPGGYATVWQEGTSAQWTVSAKSPFRIGAGLYRLETVTGTVRHSVESLTVAALSETLPRATEIVTAAANVATAINQGSRAMSIQDKFRRLAERSKAVPAKLGERADAVTLRWDALEARGGTAFAGHEAVLADAEQGVTAAEDALNQLTNGAPVSGN